MIATRPGQSTEGALIEWFRERYYKRHHKDSIMRDFYRETALQAILFIRLHRMAIKAVDKGVKMLPKTKHDN